MTIHASTLVRLVFAVLGLSEPVETGGLTFGPFEATPINVAGDNLDASLQWDRPTFSGPTISGLGPVQYHVLPVQVETTGTYQIDTAFDYSGYLHLYEGQFDPLDQLAGLIEGDSALSGSGSISAAFNTGTTYFVVASAFSDGDVGTFTHAISGPGGISIGQPQVDPDIDEYTLDLTGKAGEPIDVVLTGHAGSDFRGELLELIEPGGTTVLATAQASPLGVSPDNYQLGILDFVLPQDGVYTLRLTSVASGAYAVVVTDPLTFESEPNDDPAVDALRDLTVTQNALGFLSAAETDHYVIDLTAGEIYTASAVSLFDAALDSPLNTLDVRFAVIGPDGTTIVAQDQNSLGGKNATAAFVATTTGRHTVQVVSESGSGEYRVSVTASTLELVITQSNGSTEVTEDGLNDTIDFVLGSISDWRRRCHDHPRRTVGFGKWSRRCDLAPVSAG